MCSRFKYRAHSAAEQARSQTPPKLALDAGVRRGACASGRGRTMKPKQRQAESLKEMHQAWSPSRRSMSLRVYSSTSNPGGTCILRSGSPSCSGTGSFDCQLHIL